jgi:hypothetical protein
MLARNLTALLGFSAIVGGCYFAWPPLAGMVGGGLLLGMAVFGHLRSGPKGSTNHD